MPRDVYLRQASRRNSLPKRSAAVELAAISLKAGGCRLYEAARRRGELPDYHVFAAGSLQQLTLAEFPPLLPTPGGTTPLSATGPNVLTIDSRLKLALDIAPTLRLGQVARLMQIQVDLAFEIVDEVSGALSLGGFAHFPGRGKKNGPGALSHALSNGYLEHLEAD